MPTVALQPLRARVAWFDGKTFDLFRFYIHILDENFGGSATERLGVLIFLASFSTSSLILLPGIALAASHSLGVGTTR